MHVKRMRYVPNLYCGEIRMGYILGRGMDHASWDSSRSIMLCTVWRQDWGFAKYYKQYENKHSLSVWEELKLRLTFSSLFYV